MIDFDKLRKVLGPTPADAQRDRLQRWVDDAWEAFGQWADERQAADDAGLLLEGGAVGPESAAQQDLEHRLFRELVPQLACAEKLGLLEFWEDWVPSGSLPNDPNEEAAIFAEARERGLIPDFVDAALQAASR